MADEPHGTLIRSGRHRPHPGRPGRRPPRQRGGRQFGRRDRQGRRPGDRRVRTPGPFLEVGSGGFLGLGEKRQLIPVDAISRVDDDTVQISKSRSHVAGGPVYDPSVVVQRQYYEDLYGYWDFEPFWAPGYVYRRPMP